MKRPVHSSFSAEEMELRYDYDLHAMGGCEGDDDGYRPGPIKIVDAHVFLPVIFDNFLVIQIHERVAENISVGEEGL